MPVEFEAQSFRVPEKRTAPVSSPYHRSSNRSVPTRALGVASPLQHQGTPSHSNFHPPLHLLSILVFQRHWGTIAV